MFPIFIALNPFVSTAQPFHLPTANRALFETDGGARFFVGTVGKPWTSGMFGCVRSDGTQFHEGLDIRCLKRNGKGEPTDPVLASADGTVAYFSSKPGLSNYGNYIILRHRLEGIEIYTLYAHLSLVRDDLRVGTSVKAGERIAVMGRTSNTPQPISKERAHVHFEINFLINERFPEWFKKNFPGKHDDHGQWNGRNLVGLDPRAVLLAQREQGSNFSLLQFIRTQTELCRIVVRDKDFPWTQRYRPLIRRNAIADREGVAGYEMALNYAGVPFQLIPRAESELGNKARIHLVTVNEAEQRAHPCRKLISKVKGRWQLTAAALQWIELLTY